MSGIAKPMIYFATAIDPTQSVPAEGILTFEKIDIPALPDQPASTAKYGIVFVMVEPNTLPITIWWAASGTRDTSYTNTKTTLGASIA
jgi:hypothetical protein